jgi:hypothetical protein
MIEQLAKNDEAYEAVVRALVLYTSVPFLELVALTPAKESKVEQIVDDLERRHCVLVHGKGDPTHEIVTVAPTRYDQLVRELYL